MNSTTDIGNEGLVGPDVLTERLARCTPRDVISLIDQGADPNGWVWCDVGLQKTPLAMAIDRKDNPCIQAMLEKLATKPDIPMFQRYDVGGDGSMHEQSTLFDALVAYLVTEESLTGSSGAVFHNVKVFMMNQPIPHEWRIGIGEAFLKSVRNQRIDASGTLADDLAYLLREASFPQPECWNEVINLIGAPGEFIDHIFNEEMLRETLVKIVDSAVADGLHVDAISGHYFHLVDYYPMTLLQMAVLHDDTDLVKKFVDLGADTTLRFPEDGGKTREEWRGADLVALARLAERNTVLPMLEAAKARDVVMRTVVGVLESASGRTP